MAVHFIRFTDTRQLASARAIFGEPDFIHRRWDRRAEHEIVPGDVAVFASGSEAEEPASQAFDDSAHF